MFRRLTTIAVACALLGCSVARAEQPIRVFGMSDPVQSHKRGICANMLQPDDFRALAPGVSWYYNWHFKGPAAPDGVTLEFIPMVWGDTPNRIEGLREFLAQGHRPRAIFVANEPNLKGQAFITPEQTADLARRVRAISGDIPLVGPHMAIGSAPNASTQAFDPIQQKPLNYTFMMPFLKAFFHYAGETPIDGVGVHTYKKTGEAKWCVDTLYKQFGKPVWVTEYAWWAAPNEAESIRYLVQTTDFLERDPNVAGYAWFKERIKQPTLRLLKNEPGQLTALGRAYVDMPVHEADVYYRTPGKLSAARYVTTSDTEIDLADDPADFVKMISTKADARLAYNLVAHRAGEFALRLSLGGEPGRVMLYRGEELLATFASTGSPTTQPGDAPAKLTVITPAQRVALREGAQQLELRFERAGQWITHVEVAD